MTITAVEFVSKTLNDKAFLLEACKNIPDELIQEDNDKQAGQVAQDGEPSEDLYHMMGRYFAASSEAMGCALGQEELEAEYRSQVEGMPKFAKIRFVVRLLRTLAKAGKGKKRK